MRERAVGEERERDVRDQGERGDGGLRVRSERGERCVEEESEVRDRGVRLRNQIEDREIEEREETKIRDRGKSDMGEGGRLENGENW